MAGAAVNATVKWEDEDFYLQDFTQRFTLPQIAKITKGEYLSLGVPSLTNPSLSQIVILTHAGKRLKVAAQCVKFKDGSKVVPVGTKLAIPDNYEGWFEILSEDGRAVRCIESVAELLKKFPETCLVRENIKAYLAKTDDMEIISDKTRTVAAGETLVLVSEVHVTPVRSKSSGRYLRCFTTKGETVFLSFEQKGKFSPVAGEDNISGVHTIKNLLSKRFPLMVRLVHGKPPCGIKSNSHFMTEMRLYSLFEEESIVALSLLNNSHIVALPPSAPLKVQAPRNQEVLTKLKDYEVLVEKCKTIVQEIADKIQIFDISVSKELREIKAQPKQRVKNLTRIHRSASDPNGKYGGSATPENVKPEDSYDEIDQIYDYVRGFAPLPQKIASDFQVDINGNVESSPSHSMTPSNSATTTDSTDTTDSPEEKPEPPPIETIPVRRISKDEGQGGQTDKANVKSTDLTSKDMDLVEGHIYEKVGRKNAPKSNPETSVKTQDKLFVPNQKNHGVKNLLMKSPAQHKIQHKSRFFKHSKSSPALKDAQKNVPRHKTGRSKSLTTSPLFNIRYKSLINLAIDFDTLDSSNSGGQISLGSGGSKCERRKKLLRPKSLTDLFGDADQIEIPWKHRNSENCIMNGIENRKLIFSHESANGRLLNGSHNKRLGTLYL